MSINYIINLNVGGNQLVISKGLSKLDKSQLKEIINDQGRANLFAKMFGFPISKSSKDDLIEFLQKNPNTRFEELSSESEEEESFNDSSEEIIESSEEDISLYSLTVEELRGICREGNIVGYSKANKNWLVDKVLENLEKIPKENVKGIITLLGLQAKLKKEYRKILSKTSKRDMVEFIKNQH